MPGITKDSFGTTDDGNRAEIYTLTNSKGLVARITDYGGTVTELWVPDRQGNMGDIVLGFDNLKDYEQKSPYFGSLIGRCGNRIAGGKFKLDGKEYTLAKNNNNNHLHGGLKGFDKVVWDAEPFENDEQVGLKLDYLSKDMEEGYPGNLDVSVTYTLTNRNELRIDYQAVTDAPTICNLTNHCYFNLLGQGLGNICSHELLINADYFTPVDQWLIPTGELREVKSTPMDFMQMKPIGTNIDADDIQIKYGSGYDHNWVLNKDNNELSLAAKVYEPVTGRMMEIHTTQPAIQFYSGNYLNDTLVAKQGKRYNQRYGFCLETQHYPDSPNKPDFPSTVLRPGQTYRTTTIHNFMTK